MNALATAFILVLGLGQIDPNAMALLAKMSATLSSASSLVVTARVEREQLDERNQMLNYYGTTHAALLRPNRLYAATAGDLQPLGTWYDGALLTVYRPESGIYEQASVSESDDAVLRDLSGRFSMTSPLAPFLDSRPYEQLTRGIQSARIIADVPAGDVLCRQLAFTGADVDWQIWITIDDPLALPARMAAVFKRLPGEPRLVVEFLTWGLNVPLAPSTFRFRPPAGATETGFDL